MRRLPLRDPCMSDVLGNATFLNIIFSFLLAAITYGYTLMGQTGHLRFFDLATPIEQQYDKLRNSRSTYIPATFSCSLTLSSFSSAQMC